MSQVSRSSNRGFLIRVSCLLVLTVCSIGYGQELATVAVDTIPIAEPHESLDRIQQLHSEVSPVLVSQGELDQLISPEGGGACPLAAGLIAVQGLRSMAGLPLDQHPHRTALRMFQAKPELKEGRISNQRFVDLLAYLWKGFDESPIAITTVSSQNSDHAASGSKWSDADGPDLSTDHGELKILAYTVTLSDGTVRGRHFVLLKQSDGRKISFLNPGKPEKDYEFVVEYRGDTFDSKQRVFFHSPAGFDDKNTTFELNTVFSVRLITDHKEQAVEDNASIQSVNARIDELTVRLRESGEFTSPNAWRRKGASFGLPGLDLPKQLGGGGWSASDTIEVFRHAGRHNLNLRDVVGGAHGRPLAQCNTSIAQETLTKIIAGEAYIAVAITEPEAGTDMRQMQSKAVRDGEGFRLTGRKLWNARLREATHVVLYTLATKGERGERTAFLLPIDHPGLRIVDRQAHGLTGNSFGGLEFDDMVVSKENLIGEDGDGGRIFDDHFLYWRLMQAAAAIGCGEAALDQMADRIATREVFGGPIGRFTHLQQPIGEYLTKLRMAMALAREAALLIDNGNYKAAAPLVNGLKAEGVEIALAACDAAMRAHGALGYSNEVDLGDRVRDLMGLRIADGTTDVMRMTVVRSKYGDELWDMAIRSYRSDASRQATIEE